MKLYPTHTAAHLAVAGTVMVGVGLVFRTPAVVGWGASILFALALARAATLVSVARIRAAGFEMLWSSSKRVARTTRGSEVKIEAEVRNRDTLSARYVRLRAVASSQLEVEITPDAGEVTAGGRLKVEVRVKTPRVGQHGIHGLALEVHGAPGLFEVPLTFANPYGIEVLPRPFAPMLGTPRGGRSRLSSAVGRPGRSRGDGTDLRELRELLPGDSFRRIAWKASARRGKLLVREFEREERDVVWVVVDGSTELWAGPLGRAPLDFAIDEAMAVIARHLARGDRVGLCVTSPASGADRSLPRPPRIFVRPDDGPQHAHRLAHALAIGCSCFDADRSDLDESDVALRVLEHLRPLDPKGLLDLKKGDLDTLAQRAEAIRHRAPFAVPAPLGRSPRERILRRYLACYGVDPAAATSRESDGSGALAHALHALGTVKPHPSIVYIVASLPDDAQESTYSDVLRRLRRIGAALHWSVPRLEEGLLAPWDLGQQDAPERATAKFRGNAPASATAVAMRVRIAERKRERVLRRLGVRVRRLRALHAARPSPEIAG